DHQQRTQPEGNLDRNRTTIHIPRSNTLATGPPPDRHHEGPDSACRIKDSNPDNTESPVTTAYNTAANAAAAMDPIAYSTVDIPESPPTTILARTDHFTRQGHQLRPSVSSTFIHRLLPFRNDRS